MKPASRARAGHGRGSQWSVRSHLIVLVLTCLLPALVFSLAAVLLFARMEQAGADRTLRSTARALSSTVDRKVDASFATLRTLGASDALAAGRLGPFAEEARRVIDTMPDWANVALFDRSGRRLLVLEPSLGSPGGADINLENLRRVVETGKPFVTALFRGPHAGWVMSTVQPVSAAGQVQYVLSAALRPSALTAILDEQSIPEEWVGAIVDRAGTIVANTGAPDRFLGRRVGGLLWHRMDRVREAIVPGVTLDGAPVRAAFQGSPATGLVAVVGMPTVVFDRVLWGSLSLAGGTSAALLAVAIALSAALARRIARPLVRLVESAEAVQRGEIVDIGASSIRELAELHRALEEASATRRAHDAEHERRLLAEARRAEAEAASLAKDRFLATVSHELRTPLTTLLTSARLLRFARPGAEETARIAAAIERNTVIQTRLVDDLLDVSRALTGKLALDLRPVDLARVVRADVETILPTAEAKRIEVRETLASVGPVVGDEARLHQVFVNLLVNAVKFTPPGGSVHVALTEVEEEAVIAVTDTGEGIDPAFLPRVFEPFEQGETAHRGASGGLGLGLAIVQNVVALHGGRIEAHSEGRGCGAQFVVRLPLVRDVPGDAESAEPRGVSAL